MRTGPNMRVAAVCLRWLLIALLPASAFGLMGTRHIPAARLSGRRIAPDGYIILLKQEPAAAAAAQAAAESASAAGTSAATDETQTVSPKAGLQSVSIQAYAQQLANTAAATASRAGISSKIRYTYRYSLSGFSTSSLSSQEIAMLNQDPDVQGVYRDELVQGTTYSTTAFLGLTSLEAKDGTGGVWPQVGGTGAAKAGEGVVIGVLDSGIWPETNCFSDRVGLAPNGRYAYTPLNSSYFSGTCQTGDWFTSNNCNRKVIGCRWYNKGLIGSGSVQTIDPKESNSCRDVQGHGDHVAGIAAGNFGPAHPLGTSSGMAPRARIAVYKVLWGPDLIGATSDVAAAIDQAVKDGVDIINYSASSPSVSKSVRRVLDIHLMNAARAGVFIAAAAGNGGPGPSTVDFQVPWVVSVGASRHDRAIRAVVRLGNGRTFTGAGVEDVQLGPARLVLGSKIAAAGSANSDAAQCGWYTLDPTKAVGKVVACERGSDYDFLLKAEEVKRAGGVGMVLMNVLSFRDDVVAIKYGLPTVHLPRNALSTIRSYAAGATATVTMQPAQPFYKQPAPQIAGFSSRGPALVGRGAILKPDIVAPGVEVFAAWSPGDTDIPVTYSYDSGTSMSTPHIAGLAALLRQKYPTWSPMAIKSALMTTAYQTTRSGTPGQSFGTPLDYGAGHVDPQKMFNPGLVFDSSYDDWSYFVCGVERWPSDGYCSSCDSNPGPKSCDPANLNQPSIALPGLAVGVPKTVTRTVRNVMTVSASFTVSVTYDGNAAGFISVTVSPRIATIRAGASRAFRITVTVSEGAAHGQYYFAAVTWTGSTGTVTKIPVAVSASLLQVPEEVTLPLNPGYTTYTINPAFTGTLNMIPTSLVPAVIIQRRISQGAEVVLDVTAPAGTRFAAFRLFQSDLPSADYDLDFCLIEGENVYPLYTNCQSSPTANEALYLTFHSPLAAARSFTISVEGFTVPDGPVTFSLHVWFITNNNVSNGTSSMEITPSTLTTQLGIQAAIQVMANGVNNSGTPARRYLGRLDYVKDGIRLDTTRVLVGG